MPPVSHAEGRVRFQEAERKENWKNASLHRCRAVKRRTQRKGIYLLFAQIWHPRPLRLAETVRKKNSLSPLDLELGVEAWYCQGSPHRGACCEQSQTGGASRNRKSTDNNHWGLRSQLHLQQICPSTTPLVSPDWVFV